MILEDVHIFEDWATMGQRIIVRGRPHPGAPPHYLKGDGSWTEITEAAGRLDDVEAREIGITLPEGALDAICRAHLGIAAPTPAAERHLLDAIGTRDRLLTLLEGGPA